MSAKTKSYKTAIDIAKITLGSTTISHIPNKQSAEIIADFIETLAERIEKMEESLIDP